ncbi:NAD(P)/FAD-dependent oxidoreductase [Mycoplasmopsis agassizii]|uniref:dihydrolipoyl dehydrogenase family protein n=1 Tax=Mycoplasmopsis agassizii TaxID=33922 RepID=UPI00352712A9
MKKFDVVVIGAGPGGYTLAAQLSSNGKKVALIERNKLGGTCVNIGCIPTKSLITSARSVLSMKKAADYGVKVADFKVLLAKIAQNAADVSAKLNGAIAGALEGAKVKVFQGKTAKFLDDKTIDLEGEKITAEKFVIATGSRSRQFKITNSAKAAGTGRLIHSTSAIALTELPEKLVIIGTGVVALEFAFYFSTLGSKVILLEYGPKAMPAYDRDLANEIEKMLKQNHVEIFTDVRFKEFDDELDLVIEHGGKTLKVKADKYFAAVGRYANSELANGVVDIDERGNIVVDEFLRTSKPHIYAMGDVTGKKMLSSVSYKHGDQVFQHIMGLNVDKVNVDHVPSSLYLSLDVASVGRNEQQLEKDGVKFEKIVVSSGQLPRLHAEQNTSFGFIKLLVDPKEDRLLGAHLILKDASLLINTLALAVSGKIKLHDLFTIGHTHPTVSEGIYYALRGHYLKK